MNVRIFSILALTIAITIVLCASTIGVALAFRSGDSPGGASGYSRIAASPMATKAPMALKMGDKPKPTMMATLSPVTAKGTITPTMMRQSTGGMRGDKPGSTKLATATGKPTIMPATKRQTADGSYKATIVPTAPAGKSRMPYAEKIAGNLRIKKASPSPKVKMQVMATKKPSPITSPRAVADEPVSGVLQAPARDAMGRLNRTDLTPKSSINPQLPISGNMRYATPQAPPRGR